MHNTYTKILAETQKFFKETGYEKAVIGLSGGIDSSVALKIAVDALGADKVTAIIMSDKGISLEENLQHAKILCQYFEVESYKVQINKLLPDFLTLPWRPNEMAHMNTKARIRMTILYNYANTRNALVIGASNKSELSIGYGTKYGDMGADLYIIGDLYKNEVFKMAEHLDLPKELIEKSPSAELAKGQTDEGELGMPYREIDSILQKTDEGISREDLIDKGITPNSVHKTLRLQKNNSHKLKPVYIIPAH